MSDATTVPFLALQRLLPSGGIIGRDGDAFGIAPKFEGFVAPSFKEREVIRDPRVLLVSARGATGKSVLARRLSTMTQAPLWRLDAGKAVSADALSGRLDDYLGPSGLAKFKKQPGGLIIVDALDEARIRVSGASWEEFLDSLAGVADQGRRLVLLGRERIAEEVWMHLTDAGVGTSWYELSHFAAEQQATYVDQGVRRLGDLNTDKPTYQEARDAVLLALSRAVGPGSADSFVGYAPVLDAVVRLLAKTNHLNVKNEFLSNASGRERIHVLTNILTTLLTREHAKVATAIAELGLEPSAGYRPSEQIEWLAHELMAGRPPALDWCPTESRATYAATIGEFLKDHPFRDENRWASPVFSAFIGAELFGDPLLRDALMNVGNTTGLLFEFTVNLGAASTLDEWQFAALQTSMFAGESRELEAAVAISVESASVPADTASGELVVFDDQAARGTAFDLVLEEEGELRLFGPTASLSVDFPGRVEVSPAAPGHGLGPDCFIRCSSLHVHGDRVEVRGRTHVASSFGTSQDSGVSLEVSTAIRFDGSLEGSPRRDEFEIRAPESISLTYPWVDYRGAWIAPTEDSDERAVRLVKMLMNLLRNHGHVGLKAAYDKKLQGRQSVKGSEFIEAVAQLEKHGVIEHANNMLFLQPSWEQHRFDGKGRPGMPSLEDKADVWDPVLKSISNVLRD